VMRQGGNGRQGHERNECNSSGERSAHGHLAASMLYPPYPGISIILSRVFLLATPGLALVLASHPSTSFNVTECLVMADSRISMLRGVAFPSYSIHGSWRNMAMALTAAS
jgi:hypothetical protein